MSGKRFLEEAVHAAADECIIWPYFTRDGYGRVWVDGHVRNAHAVACELAHGARPPMAHAAHSCDNRACVNPAHLRWATAAENAADRLRHGAPNVAPFQRKLDPSTVMQIRALSRGGHTHAALARRFGVGIHAISRAVRRETWRHVA